MQTVSVALAGLGGYGGFYVSALLEQGEAQGVRFVAGIDPAPERCTRLEDLRRMGLPIFPTLESCIAHVRPDLMILALPIHLHAPATVQALEAECHVLCEKPLCARPREAAGMCVARERAKRLVAIGYQWSFGEGLLRVKADIFAGRFGKPKRLKCIALTPRTHDYYTRNRWAGALRGPDGAWIRDSPANNANAHYLHNLLFLLGPPFGSALPISASAELYRANSITSFDTCAARLDLADGAEVLFYSSHAVEQDIGPDFICEFERGIIRYERKQGRLLASTEDGTEVDYGQPSGDSRRKLWWTVDAIRGGPPVPCSIEGALGHVWAIEGLHASCPEIACFSAALKGSRTWNGQALTHIPGLEDVLTEAYRVGKLPSELGVPWSMQTKKVSLDARTVSAAPLVE